MNITRIKYYFIGKRWRHRRPIGVILFSWAVLILPAYYYVSAASFSVEKMADFTGVLEAMSLAHRIISLCGLICFVALFFVVRAGFFIFFVLSLSFIVYNLYVFFTSGNIFDIESVVMAFCTVSIFIFFSSREQSAPYVYGRRRGWRREVRRSFDHFVSINGTRRGLININSRGMLVKWKNANLSVNDETECTITVQGKRFHLDGVVVRRDEETLAFAFRYVDRKIQKQLYLGLKDLEEEKAAIQNDL